jgi:hypothetical protein
MQNMSDSTKLLLGGAAIAFLGYFLPFFQYTFVNVSLADLSKAESTITFTMIGLIAMVALCFIPSVYKNNPRSFVTYQLIAWAANILFVVIFIVNTYSKTSAITSGASDLMDMFGLGEIIGDSLKPKLGIGAFMYIGGNALFAFGLFQIWNNVGGGYAPNVYDAGAGGYAGAGGFAGYPDTMPVDDYPVAPPPKAPPAEYPPIRQPVYHAPPKPQKPKTQAWLVDDYSGQTYQLSRGTTTIGRTADNDVCFSDSKVSKHHAKIIEERGHFRLVDLASTNGTYVNGKSVRQPVLIYPDDTIRFGDRFKVRFVGMKR